MSFFLEYMKNPRRIGAVAPSGQQLVAKMVEHIPFEQAKVIVEYGPGTGVFTKEIVRRLGPHTTFIIIEQNQSLYHTLCQEIGTVDNVFLYNDDAGNINAILGERGFTQVDTIISGLPFASLPTAVSRRIMEQTSIALADKGEFITFQYTMFKRDFFLHYMNLTQVERVWANLPPAFVLRFGKKPNHYQEP